MRPACVGSVTVTLKLPLAVLPRVSLAVQATLVDPIANVLPDAGAHVTGLAPSTRSRAVAVKLTTAPLGDVAVAVMSAGSVSAGGVVSTIVNEKSAVPVQPFSVRASTVKVDVPSAPACRRARPTD